MTADHITHILPLIATTLLFGKLTTAFHVLEHLLRVLLGLFGDVRVYHRSLCERQSAVVNTKAWVGHTVASGDLGRVSARDTRMIEVGLTFPRFAMFELL